MDTYWKKILLPTMGVLAFDCLASPNLLLVVGPPHTNAVMFKRKKPPHTSIAKREESSSSSLEYCIESNTLEFNFAAKDGGLSS